MDMSGSYHSAAKEYLPEVDIVFDRFHVTALANRALDEIRRRECGKWKGKNQALKGVRFLLLKNYTALSKDQAERVNTLFQINMPLFQAHALKEQLRLFWEMERASKAGQFLLNWIDSVRSTGLKPLIRVANTLEDHLIELLNYYKHNKISNGKIEGINHKIKTLKRQSYGFRDMEYFKS